MNEELNVERLAILSRIVEAKPRMDPFRSGGFINKDYDMARISIDLPIIEAKRLMADLKMNKAFYFVGNYADVGHDEKAAGIERGRAWPVFSTYDKSNPDQKHTNAWFVFEKDAIEWAKFKNT